MSREKLTHEEQQHLSRTLRQMEQIRMDSYEAESAAEEHRLDREYGRLHKSIQHLLDRQDAQP